MQDDQPPITYLYIQVADRIERATDGMRHGDRLPAQQAMATEYGVTIATLRRAIRLLTERGRVRVLHARGTYVVDPNNNAGRTYSCEQSSENGFS